MLYLYRFKRLRRYLRDRKILLNTQTNYSEFERRFFTRLSRVLVFNNTHYEY